MGDRQMASSDSCKTCNGPEYGLYEAAFVFVLLACSAALTGGRATDWISALAVFFTFTHGQISFDFQEAQDALQKPTVPAYKWSGRFFVIKECLWVSAFTLLQAWPLLAGTVIFATYPYWRRWFRRRMAMLHKCPQRVLVTE